MRYLTITFKDGTEWIIPADVIAQDRARVLEKDHGRSFDEEFRYTMRDVQTMIYWAREMMTWKDLMPYARLNKKTEVDYNKEFSRANMNFLEK